MKLNQRMRFRFEKKVMKPITFTELKTMDYGATYYALNGKSYNKMTIRRQIHSETDRDYKMFYLDAIRWQADNGLIYKK